MEHDVQKITNEVMTWFRRISDIPRASGFESQIRTWLVSIATENGWTHQVDKKGNLVIKVPATRGFETKPTLVIQGHLDMVCQKTPESTHDFAKDAIEFVTKDEWLFANQTTLGADNGIAIALALTLSMDPVVKHPKLELLFTVEEESGLHGALELDPALITGKTMLNLDSEQDGVITVGCAGGRATHMTLALSQAETRVPRDFKLFALSVSKLRGGHSGVNIKDQRANSIKLLARVMQKFLSQPNNHRRKAFIHSLESGTAHNAIPRDGKLEFWALPRDIDLFRREFNQLVSDIKSEVKAVDSFVHVELLEVHEVSPDSQLPISETSSKRIIELLNALPHGVNSMSLEIQDLVETSNNLAKAWLEAGSLKVLLSQRSSVMSRLDDMCSRVESIGRLAGCDVQTEAGYPAWEPKWEAPLLLRSKLLYRSIFGHDPIVEVMHAGLECGIIGAKIPDMEMISFGPTIRNPHTPTESLLTTDIPKIYKLAKTLLAEL
jgi:dipeptidase D